MSKPRMLCHIAAGFALSQCLVDGFLNQPGPAIAWLAIALWFEYSAWVWS